MPKFDFDHSTSILGIDHLTSKPFMYRYLDVLTSGFAYVVDKWQRGLCDSIGEPRGELTQLGRMPPRSRGRRLTLAASTRLALHAQGKSDDCVVVEEDDASDQRRCKEGRAALSRMVAFVVETSSSPKPVHGVEPLKFKFWAQDDDSDESDEDEITPEEFLAKAKAAGFTMQDLKQAEKELSEVTTDSIFIKDISPEPHASRIVSAIHQRKKQNHPWSGPLPPLRVSPPRTLGDAFAMARRSNVASRSGATLLNDYRVSSCTSSDKRATE